MVAAKKRMGCHLEVVCFNFKVSHVSPPQMGVLIQVICYSRNQWALELELKTLKYKCKQV